MDPLEVIGNSINRDLAHLSAVSQNIANVNTPGYLSVESFDAVVQQNNTTSVTKVDTGVGGVKDSQRELDWAILTPGYFVVEQDNELLLSRYGRFHIDTQGYLRHVSGGFVQGEGGRIYVDDNNISVTQSGEIKRKNQSIDILKIVTAQELETTEHSAGLYRPVGAVENATNLQIKTKAINMSNVNSAGEMTKMIGLNRHVQSLQKAAAAYDQMLNMGINEMGKR